MDNPFYRLAPFIQEFIYRNNWESLRAIQTAACDAIFNHDDNLLLCSGTASGKTEAAFFPILTLLWEKPSISVGALYIGPLKALINDQFLRLNDLCAEADIPIWHWHGDVSQSHRQKLMKKPSGILQITPESLEAMLMRRHSDIVRLFGDLRFVVIDEVHSLMRGDRGGQVLCLLERLIQLSGANPRRIGLSATIGDQQSAGAWLAAGTCRGCIIPRFAAPAAKWRLAVEDFPIYEATEAKWVRSSNADTSAPALPEPERPSRSGQAPPSADPGLGYIFERTLGKKCLIFSNSREECEAVTSSLRQYCEQTGAPDRFLIHHGNLSASYRETAEGIMKDDTMFYSTCTTATLELGIDIGRLERAFQIDAPFTVSSFLQRMGRTGRRGDPQEMHFVIREDEPLPNAPVVHLIPWKLLQAIALIQLYLEEKWVEPPRFDTMPFSLLYHQTMSTLASCGEMRPPELAQRVLGLSMFRRVDPQDYKTLLYHLLRIDHIQRTDEGGLIVGLAGERIVNSYKFYAVFKEDEYFTVRWQSQELGTIVMPPPVGERIALAGRVWVNMDIDYKKKLIFVEPIQGKVPAFFGMCPGDIHTKVLERMARILQEDTVYSYLLPNARRRLAETRELAKKVNFMQMPLSLGGDVWAITPWLGSYAFLAMERFLKIKCGEALGLKSLDSARPYFIQFKMKAGPEEFREILREEAEKELDPMDLVFPNEVPLFEKYDEFVPPELIRKSFSRDVLNIADMRRRILESSDERFFLP